jgi:hypothetical protein
MNGLGAIHYIGHPADVTTNLNGFGSISQAEDGSSSSRSDDDRPNAADEQPQPKQKKSGDSTAVI